MRVLAIVLIVLGALALGYQGFTYVTRDTVAQVGPMEVTTERQKTVWIPPVVGGIALTAGLILFLAGGKRTI